MKRTILLFLILLLPVYAGAEYKIYLKNGSIISEVRSYDESGGEVTIYFRTGSMIISQKDILKIEGSETTDTGIRTEENQDIQEKQGKQEKQEQPVSTETPSQELSDSKNDRLNALKDKLDSINSEIVAAHEEERRLVAEINTRTGRRYSYNLIQLKQLEKDLEPLRRDLSSIQQKKIELLQRKSAIEGEIRGLQ